MGVDEFDDEEEIDEEVVYVTDKEIDLEILQNYKEMSEDFRNTLGFSDYYNFYRYKKERDYSRTEEDSEVEEIEENVQIPEELFA